MHSSVYVTVPDMRTATLIGQSIVERGLAACVNIWRIGSIFRWKGDVLQEEEVAMLFKVTDDGFESLRAAIVSMHPYEVPCIVRYPIAEGHPPYMDWIAENVRTPASEYQKAERT